MLPLNARPEFAEAIGVFAMVFAGGAAILADQGDGSLGQVGISLTFGFAILALVYAIGHICGAHFNPAITLAFATTRHFPWHRVPGYMAAQFVGAILAGGALHLLFGDVAAVTTRLHIDVAPWQGVGIEALATFFLAFVIIGVATDTRAARGAAGMAIGLTVAMGALFAGPFTGGSMNPARSLGPAVAAGDLSGMWLYMLGPAIGAVTAMAVYELLRPGGLHIEAREPLGALGPIRFDPSAEDPHP